jgi:hypothetical protein
MSQNNKSEPHTIVVKLWHNARWHDIAFNAVTSPILQRLYHNNPREYYNPTPSEWDQLAPFVIDDSYRGVR